MAEAVPAGQAVAMAIPESRWQRAGFALAGGAVVSLVKLALHCRVAGSAACVMEKRYYWALLPIEAVIYAAGVFVVLTMMRMPPRR